MPLRQVGARLTLDNLESFLTGMARASAATDDFVSDLEALSRKRVGLDTSGLGSLGSQLDQAGNRVGVFGSKFSALQVVGLGALTTIGSEAVKLTGRLAALGAQKAIEFGLEGISDAGSAEQTLADLEAQSGATAEQMEQLNSLLASLSLRPDLKIGFEGAGDAVEQLLNLGIRLPDILGGGLEQVVLLQNAIGGTTAQSGELFAQAVKQFRVPPNQYAELTNQLIALRRAGLDATDILGLLAQGGGIAGNVVDFGEFAKLAAIARPSFGSGSDAGTAIKTFLARAADPPKEMREALRAYNIDLFDNATGELRNIEDLARDLNQVLNGTITQSVTTGGRSNAEQQEFERLQKLLASRNQKIRDIETGVDSFLSDDAKNRRLHELRDEVRHIQEQLNPLAAITGQTSQISRQLTEKEKLDLAEALGGADAIRLILGLSNATQEQIASLDELFATTDGAQIAAIRTATFQAKLETLGDVFTQVRRDAATPLLGELTPGIVAATDLVNKLAPALSSLGSAAAAGIAPAIDTFIRFTDALDGLDGKESILTNIGSAIAEAFDVEPLEDFFNFLSPQDLDLAGKGLDASAVESFRNTLSKTFGEGENKISVRVGLTPDTGDAKDSLRRSLFSGGGAEVGEQIDAQQEDRFAGLFGGLQVELQKGLDGIKLTKLKIRDFIDFNFEAGEFDALGGAISAQVGSDGKITVTTGDLVFDLTDEVNAVRGEFNLLKQAFDTGGLFGGTATDERGREVETEGVFDVLRTQIQAGLDELTQPYGFTLESIRSAVTSELSTLEAAFQNAGIDVAATLDSTLGTITAGLQRFLGLGSTVDERGRETPDRGLLTPLQGILDGGTGLDLAPVAAGVATEFALVQAAFDDNGLQGVGDTFYDQFTTQVERARTALFGGTTVDKRGREVETPGLIDLSPGNFLGDLKTEIQGQLDALNQDGAFAVSFSSVQTAIQGEIDLLQGAFNEGGLTGVFAAISEQVQGIDTGAILGNVSRFVGDIFNVLAGFNNLGTDNLTTVVEDVSGFIQGLLGSGASLLRGDTEVSGDTSQLLAGADNFVASLIDRLTETLKAADVESISVAASSLLAAFFGRLRDTLSKQTEGTEEPSETQSAVARLVTTIFSTLEATLRNKEFGENIGAAAGDLIGAVVDTVFADLKDPAAALEKIKGRFAKIGSFEDFVRSIPTIDFLFNLQEGLSRQLLGVGFSENQQNISQELDDLFVGSISKVQSGFKSLGDALGDAILAMLAGALQAIPDPTGLSDQAAEGLLAQQSFAAQLARLQEQRADLAAEPGTAATAQRLLSQIGEVGADSFDFTSPEVQSAADQLGIVLSGNNALFVDALQKASEGATDNTERIKELDSRIVEVKAQIAAAVPAVVPPAGASAAARAGGDEPITLSGPVTLVGPVPDVNPIFAGLKPGVTPASSDGSTVGTVTINAQSVTTTGAAGDFLSPDNATALGIAPDTLTVNPAKQTSIYTTIANSEADTVTVASRGVSISSPEMSAEVNRGIVTITEATLDIPSLVVSAGTVVLDSGALPAATGATPPGTGTTVDPSTAALGLPGATTTTNTTTTINNFTTAGSQEQDRPEPADRDVNLTVEDPTLNLATRNTSLTAATANTTARTASTTTTSTKMDSRETRIDAPGSSMQVNLLEAQADQLAVTTSALSAQIDSATLSIGSFSFDIGTLTISASIVNLNGEIDQPTTTPPTTGGGGGGSGPRLSARGTLNYPGGRGIGGELGPELYVTPTGDAGLIGQGGIQAFTLPPGSRIFPADVTERIMSGSPTPITPLSDAATAAIQAAAPAITLAEQAPAITLAGQQAVSPNPPGQGSSTIAANAPSFLLPPNIGDPFGTSESGTPPLYTTTAPLRSGTPLLYTDQKMAQSGESKKADDPKITAILPPSFGGLLALPRAYALGSETYPGGRGLGGELGPELYVTPTGEVGLIGTGGIQAFTLPAGSKIYPAAVTEQILESARPNTILQQPAATAEDRPTIALNLPNQGATAGDQLSTTTNTSFVTPGTTINQRFGADSLAGDPVNAELAAPRQLVSQNSVLSALMLISTSVNRQAAISEEFGQSIVQASTAAIQRGQAITPAPSLASISPDRVARGQAITPAPSLASISLDRVAQGQAITPAPSLASISPDRVAQGQAIATALSFAMADLGRIVQGEVIGGSATSATRVQTEALTTIADEVRRKDTNALNGSISFGGADLLAGVDRLNKSTARLSGINDTTRAAFEKVAAASNKQTDFSGNDKEDDSSLPIIGTPSRFARVVTSPAGVFNEVDNRTVITQNNTRNFDVSYQSLRSTENIAADLRLAEALAG